VNTNSFKSGLWGEANSRGGFASKIPLSKSVLTPSYGAETTGSGLLSGGFRKEMGRPLAATEAEMIHMTLGNR